MAKLMSVLFLLYLLILASCATPDGRSVASGQILFEVSMTGNWLKNWFLDGEKAKLEQNENGLHIIATSLFYRDFQVRQRVNDRH